VTTRVNDLLADLKQAQKRIAELEAQQLRARIPELLGSGSRVGDVTFIGAWIGAVGSADDVRTLALELRERAGSEAAVVALVGQAGEKPSVVVATNQAARDAGANAGALVKVASGALGGGGGGKPDVAQGGGQDASKHEDALAAIRTALQAN
jgi:alanyl-tRNA synthetase